MPVIGMALLCARHGAPFCRCWPLRPPLAARPCPSGSPAFSPGCLSCRARCCPRAPCVFPLLTSALPLPGRPAPSPPASPAPLYSPPHRFPTRCHSEGRRLPPSFCTLLSAVIAFAVHSPVFSTLGFHLCPTPMSLRFPLELGRTLSTLKCYRPQAMCYPRNPTLSPQSGRFRYTARESINMQTGMWSCKWKGKMMGRQLLRPQLVDETSYPSHGRQD